MPVKVNMSQDSYLIVEVEGNLGKDDVSYIFEEFERILQLAPNLRKDLRLLVDVNQMTNIDYQGRKVVFNRLKEFGFKRISLFGKSTFIKFLIGFIIKGLGMTDMIKYFGSETDAIKWLKEPIE